MGIKASTRFHARSADALPASLYGHFTQAIYRNRPIAAPYLDAAHHVPGHGLVDLLGVRQVQAAHDAAAQVQFESKV
jgi:hypothetical protein